MIIKQEFDFAKDDKGTVTLRNTIDIEQAINAAKEATETGARAGDSNSEVMLMGFIPPEMFMFDPWLVEAEKARQYGDIGEYTRLMKKFFEVHKEFAPTVRQKYWNGGIK